MIQITPKALRALRKELEGRDVAALRVFVQGFG